MSLILLYILLIICVCCLCGMGIAMHRMARRSRVSLMEAGGSTDAEDAVLRSYVCAKVEGIVAALDGIIADVSDERLIARIAAVRADAARLLAKIEITSHVERQMTIVDHSTTSDAKFQKTMDCDVITYDAEHQMTTEGDAVDNDEDEAEGLRVDDGRRELSPVVEVTGDRMDIFDLLDDPLVEKAVKYVETNIQRPDLSVELVSAHLDVSRVYLYKKIKSATGLTPIEFIRLIRLRRAAWMLRQGGVTVSEVAGRVGFNSPRNFSKYFRDEFGVLPSAYQSHT